MHCHKKITSKGGGVSESAKIKVHTIDYVGYIILADLCQINICSSFDQ